MPHTSGLILINESLTVKWFCALKSLCYRTFPSWVSPGRFSFYIDCEEISSEDTQMWPPCSIVRARDGVWPARVRAGPPQARPRE